MELGVAECQRGQELAPCLVGRVCTYYLTGLLRLPEEDRGGMRELGQERGTLGP